jgi:hypothetical protein
MGSQKCRIVGIGKSQSVLIMINPIIPHPYLDPSDSSPRRTEHADIGEVSYC